MTRAERIERAARALVVSIRLGTAPGAALAELRAALDAPREAPAAAASPRVRPASGPVQPP